MGASNNMRRVNQSSFFLQLLVLLSPNHLNSASGGSLCLFQSNRLELPKFFLLQDVTHEEIERQAMIDDRLAVGGRLAASLAHEKKSSGGPFWFCTNIGVSGRFPATSTTFREVKQLTILSVIFASKPPGSI